MCSNGAVASPIEPTSLPVVDTWMKRLCGITVTDEMAGMAETQPKALLPLTE